MDVFQSTNKPSLPSAFNKILISLPRFIRHLTMSDRDIIIRNISLSCRVAWRSIGHRFVIPAIYCVLWRLIYVECSWKLWVWGRVKFSQHVVIYPSIVCFQWYCLKLKIPWYDSQEFVCNRPLKHLAGFVFSSLWLLLSLKLKLLTRSKK